MSVANNSEISTGETAENAGESGGITDAFGLNLTSFIFQLLNFVIVITIVWFLILKPLVKKMSERQKMVEESVDNAKKIESNLQMSEQKFQEKIDEAKVEANQVIARAQEEAAGLSGKMRKKAEADVQELIKQAKEKIGEEKDRMAEELKKETGELVMAALEKVLGQKIDEKTDKKLIEDALKKL